MRLAAQMAAHHWFTQKGMSMARKISMGTSAFR